MGYRFRTQVSVGHYYLDFYCSAVGLCIAVDGEQHAERAVRDSTRDAFLLQRGIETLRIPSLDIFDVDSPKLEKWLSKIEKTCKERVAARRLSSSP